VLHAMTWDDSDFDDMGWHDVHVHAWAALTDEFAFALDLDHILEWVHPAEPGGHFRFRIAPATLVFVNVVDVRVDHGSAQGGLELDRIVRDDPRPTPNGRMIDHRWPLDAHEGSITLRATGFRQFLRRPPVLADLRRLSLAERGGISFARGGAA
jgi:hypothetical protein